jgi:uncharacterized protein YjbJ (UPF0337 family)
MSKKTKKTARVANQATGKVKEGIDKATGSKELEAKGLAQEAKGEPERFSADATPTPTKTLYDRTVSIVAAILILTVLVQIILVKSWT